MVTRAEPISLVEIQQEVIDEDAVLLEYVLGEKKSFLFIVTRSGLQTVELPARARIEQLARLAYGALTARNQRVKFETAEEFRSRIAVADSEFRTFAGELSRMVVAPAADVIKNKRLMVVADGALQYIPFGALVLNQRYIAETNEVVVLPSASVLAALRRAARGRQPAPKTLAVLADPIFERNDERIAAEATSKKGTARQTIAHRDARRGDQSFKRLPFTRREAEDVAALVPPAMRSVMLDADASRANVLTPELARYRYLHFATHGLINSQFPELSGIILSLFDRDGLEQNGFVSLADTYGLKLNADLVVLSGCRTGLGREISGEGLVGLMRGFLFAGAKRVTVSLWDVSDEATAELMKRMYRGLLTGRRLAPAAALREAQISMIRDQKWNAPYYWAPFIMFGEPR
jgi:CHAT domain-containing protein